MTNQKKRWRTNLKTVTLGLLVTAFGVVVTKGVEWIWTWWK